MKKKNDLSSMESAPNCWPGKELFAHLLPDYKFKLSKERGGIVRIAVTPVRGEEELATTWYYLTLAEAQDFVGEWNNTNGLRQITTPQWL